MLARQGLSVEPCLPALILLCFSNRVTCFCQGLALDCDSPTYTSQGTWDYGCTLPFLACLVEGEERCLINFLPKLASNLNPTNLHLLVVSSVFNNSVRVEEAETGLNDQVWW
jgi:hypothetical protein